MPSKKARLRYIKKWSQRNRHRNAWYQFNAELRAKGLPQVSWNQYRAWKEDPAMNDNRGLSHKIWKIIYSGDYEKKHAL